MSKIPMRRCAFLTMDDPTGFTVDDDLAIGPLADLGWSVDKVSWRADADWSAYEAVVIRSPWDYFETPATLDAFLVVLERIDASTALLLNGLGAVRWNVRKTYLREVEAAGVPVIPTVWRERLGPGEAAGLFDAVGSDEIVVKPTLGANASGAFRLTRDAPRAAEVEAYYADTPLMAQPFVASVVDEGEFSVFAFGGRVAHTILKTPKPRDFRVQEEHGGRITSVTPEPELLAAAQAAFDAADARVGEALLYARADLVRAPAGSPDGFWVMEVELVEPALYFRMDAEAPRRFAAAFAARMG